MNEKLRAFLVTMGMDENATDEQARAFARENGVNVVDMTGSGKPEESNSDSAVKMERSRITAINDLGARYDMQDAAGRAISDGVSADKFRAQVLDNLSQEPQETERSAGKEIGMSEEELDNYSFVRAANFLANPDSAYAREEAALELECSRAAAEKAGKQARGIIVPVDVLARAAVSTTGGGAAGVATNFAGSSFIEQLYNAMIVKSLGASVMVQNGPTDIPRQSSTGNGYWLGEGNDAQESAFGLDPVSMSRKTVAAYTDITRKMLLDSSVGIESLVRSDLAISLALQVDLAALNGSGSSNQPLGVLNQTGINSIALGAALTEDGLIDMETECAVANALIGNLSYVFNSGVRGTMKKTPIVAGHPEKILGKDNLVNGHKHGCTNQMPDKKVLFGNWRDLLIGLYGGLDLTVDKAALALSGGVRMIAFQDTDIAVRHPESFTVGTLT